LEVVGGASLHTLRFRKRKDHRKVVRKEERVWIVFLWIGGEEKVLPLREETARKKKKKGNQSEKESMRKQPSMVDRSMKMPSLREELKSFLGGGGKV